MEISLNTSKWYDCLWAALIFFTRLPFWRVYQPPQSAYTAVVEFWPLAGWVTAGVMAGVLYGASMVFPYGMADTFGQEAVDVRRRPPGMVRRFPPSARNRLYHLWFYDYARNHEMTLFSDSVTFKNTKYYAGILLRHDHPLHDMILAYYQDFSKHVPELFTPRDK